MPQQQIQEIPQESQSPTSPTSPVSLISGQNLIQLLEHREQLKLQQDALQSELDGLNQILRVELSVRNTRRLEIDRFTVQNIVQERKTLSKEKLLEAGVTVSQLEKGTVTVPFESLRVDGRRQQKP